MRRVEAVRRQTTKAGINGSEGWMYGAVLGGRWVLTKVRPTASPDSHMDIILIQEDLAGPTTRMAFYVDYRLDD